MLDQPRALDRARLGDGPLTSLTASEMVSVERGLRLVLGMY
jgi:mRNA interferase MazF